ncbi:hypothetical protein D3C76_1680250 [compost metagenome]
MNTIIHEKIETPSDLATYMLKTVEVERVKAHVQKDYRQTYRFQIFISPQTLQLLGQALI